jgi:hypothetical protein
MILFIVPGVTVGLPILGITDWDINRNMTIPVLYVMMLFFQFKSIFIVDSFFVPTTTNYI